MNTVTHNTKNAQYKTVNSSTNWFDKNQATYSAETLENELKRRGIRESALACRWSIAPHWLENDNGKGMAWAWSIPTNQREFNLIKFYRPKAMRWSKPGKTTKVYMGQGWERLKKAVADSNILIVANGQVDHLTFIEAGHDNVISFYGENSVPKDELLKLIEALGNVATVLNWPDRDTAGITGATKLRNILHPVGVAFSAFELPYELGTKKDTNDLWIDVAFDARQFNRTLLACPLLELPSQHEATILPPVLIPTPTAVPTSKATKGDIDESALKFAVESALRQSYRLGATAKDRCQCPIHKGHNPSNAQWHFDKGFLTCYSDCGNKSFNVRTIAKAIGINIDDYRLQIQDGKTVLSMPPQLYLDCLNNYQLQFSSNRAITPQYTNMALDENILDESRLIGIQSPTGTGKTELLLQLIPKVLRQGKKVVIYGHRRKLLRNTHKRLRDAGINAINYEDATDEGLLLANVLLITADSLPRLTKQAGFDATAYGLVVLDEVTQSLYHLLKSKTLRDKTRETFMAFLQVIQHAQMLAMDANLNDETMGLLADWSTAITNAKPPKPYNILNTYRPIKGKATQFSNLSGLVENMIKRMKKGKAIAIHVPTLELGKGVYQQLASYGKGKVIYFDSETVDFERQRKALSNLDKADYQCIIYTPILGTGYDIQRHFDAVYLIGVGGHLTAHDWLQGIGRCRNARELCYFISERQVKLPHDTARAVEGVVQSRMQATPKATGFDAIDARALDGYAKMQATRNLMRNNAYGFWLEGLNRQGWMIPVLDESSNQLIEDSLKTMRESIKTASVASMTAVAEIDFVTTDSYTELRRAQDRTGQQYITEQTYWNNQAWQIFNLTGITNNEQTLNYFYHHQNRNRLIQYHRKQYGLAPQIDEEESRNQTLAHRRQYATGKDALLDTLLQVVWDTTAFADIATLQQQFTEDDVSERFTNAGLADSNGITVGLQNRLATIFNWRVDYSHKPLAVLRWVLRKYGMKLASKRHMLEGKRFYLYQFDEAEYAMLEQFAIGHHNRHYPKPDNDTPTDFGQLPPALQSQPNNKTPNKGFGGMLPLQPILNQLAVPMRE